MRIPLNWSPRSWLLLMGALPILAALFYPQPVMASEGLDSGDTAWMLTATALVLFMTIPGLSLFYGGLVRAKNVLSVLMQCFALTCVMTLVWVFWGYSLAFDTSGMEAGVVNLSSFVGGFGKAFLAGVGIEALTGTVPETVFVTFQMTFAIITPALIAGAFAERMKFSAMMLFMILWSTAVYAPICHMTWSGDGAYFWDKGILDFAGGTVVHINAGIAALVAALVIGKRRGYPGIIPPHSLVITVIGASMLWVGWFGFNAGSALAANGAAGMAMLVTQIATATAAVTWMLVEWLQHGKPSVLGVVTGAVAGLVAITPASGSVGPMGALAIGVVSGVACFWGATSLKHKLGYDDSLDAFGVHGVGGIVGALMTGAFAAESLGGQGLAEGMTIASQLWAQLVGVVITILYAGIVSFVLLKIVDSVIGLRVAEDDEERGLDISLHNEQGYYSEV
jgi:ammonium transporter, Amt family